MKTEQSIKVELWEGEDYIITGLHTHPRVYSKREAEMIVDFVRAALPKIQLDAYKAGIEKAAQISAKGHGNEVNESLCAQYILEYCHELTEIPKNEK